MNTTGNTRTEAGAPQTGPWWQPPLPLLAAAGLLVAAPFALSDFNVFLLTEALIFCLFAMSYNLLAGYGGLVSFGHAALFGIGGYGLALILAKTPAPFAVAFLSAPVLGAAASLVMGSLAVRLAAIYFALFTLAVGQVAWSVANKWTGLTNGDNGLGGFAVSIPDAISSSGGVPLYFFTLGIVAAAIGLLYMVVGSPFGCTLQAIRESPSRAEFVGVNVRRHQLLAFVVSGSLSGLAGGLFALHNHFVHPDMLFWLMSAQVLLMVLLGGVHLFWGPALGAGLVVYLQDGARRVFPDLTQAYLGEHLALEGLTLGAAALVVVLLFPSGIGGMAQGAARLASSALGAVNAPGAGPASSLRRCLARFLGTSRGLFPSRGAPSVLPGKDQDRIVDTPLPPSIDDARGRSKPVRGEPVEPPSHPSTGSGPTERGGSASAASETILQVQGLRKRFGGVRAVDGVDFSLRRGEACCIIGPNGAGKTSLFNLLTGHLAPDAGTVLFKGQPITRLHPHEICRRGIGRSFQRVNFFPRLTVNVNVQVAVLSRKGRSLDPFRPAGNPVRQETLQVLESVGLGGYAGHAAGSLSHGDQKRLELALALANNPELLLLDEPTAGMSPHETAATVALIGRVARERGLTLLFTEHDMDVVFSMAQRVTVMHQGRIMADGTPDEVRAHKEVQRIYLGEPT